MRSPFTFPQIARNCLGWEAHKSAMDLIAAASRRLCILGPMPGTSDIGRFSSGSGIASGDQIVMPFGLSTLQAIFASSLLAAKPMEQVM
jgi:hypothetical protein